MTKPRPTSGPRKALLVAATGGHLEQISRLEQAFAPAFETADFATFDDAQSQSLLAGRTVHHVGYIPPRGLREAIHAQVPALNLLLRGGYTDVLSTGSAIAIPFLLAARTLNRRAHYIESAARSEGPSLSGRLASRLPGVYLYTQYPLWAEGRWQYRGSVFDGYRMMDNPATLRPASKVVVTLGTMRGYPFSRAINAVRRTLSEVVSPDVEILWQVGDAPTAGLGIEGKSLVPAAELREAIREADLVVAHAGIGSCLQILDAGHTPVLLPRRSAMGEHIDDHQRMIAFELNRRGLAVSRDPDVLNSKDLLLAMARSVASEPSPEPFRLQGLRGSRWPDPAAVATEFEAARLQHPVS